MNEPIISPWVLYFIGVAEGLNGILTFGVAFVGAVVLLSAVLTYVNYGLDDEEGKKHWQITRKLCICFSVLLVLKIFMPSEKTLIAIMVSQNVTRADVDKAMDITGNVTKDVINALRESKK